MEKKMFFNGGFNVDPRLNEKFEMPNNSNQVSLALTSVIFKNLMSDPHAISVPADRSFSPVRYSIHNNILNGI